MAMLDNEPKQIGYVQEGDALVLKTPFTMYKEGLGKYWDAARVYSPMPGSHMIFTKDGWRYDRTRISYLKTDDEIWYEAALDRGNRASEVLHEILDGSKGGLIKRYKLAAELAQAEIGEQGWKKAVDAHFYYGLKGVGTYAADEFRQLMRRVHLVEIFKTAPKIVIFEHINPLQPVINDYRLNKILKVK